MPAVPTFTVREATIAKNHSHLKQRTRIGYFLTATRQTRGILSFCFFCFFLLEKEKAGRRRKKRKVEKKNDGKLLIVFLFADIRRYSDRFLKHAVEEDLTTYLAQQIAKGMFPNELIKKTVLSKYSFPFFSFFCLFIILI